MSTTSPTLPDLQTLTQIDPAILTDHAIKRRRKANGKEFALIKTNHHPNPKTPLAIHNYTRETHTYSLWDPITIACRGLITETTTGNIVARSFPTFFSHTEKTPYRYKPTGNESHIIAEEKIDGSIAFLFNYRNQWIWASRSVFDSPQVGFAEEIIATKKYTGITKTLDESLTYTFEIIHPLNKIGVQYHDRKDLILLAAFHKDGQEVLLDQSTLPFPRPKVFFESSSGMVVDFRKLEGLNIVNSEGFVLRFHKSITDTRPERVKVKFTSYLQLIKSKECHAGGTKEVFQYYANIILSVGSFEPKLVAQKVKKAKKSYVKALNRVADDMGGDVWVAGVVAMWNSADANFRSTANRWGEIMSIVKKEGLGGRRKEQKKQFVKRISMDDVEEIFRPALISWYDLEEDVMFKHLVTIIQEPPVVTTPG